MAMPLDGVKVLDLTRVLAGPFCTMMLADMGADVVKVEEPTKGDEQRSTIHYRRTVDHDFFYPYNRNKRSVAVNLKKPEGKEIIYGLAAKADVAVENFAPGVVKRLGIDYETLSGINPSLVYCSISGFGQTGPYRDRKAYDGIIQAMSGVMTATGFEDGPPLRFGLMVADVTGAMMAAYAIMNALYYRERTGRGQYLDVAMMDSLLTMWTTQAAEYFSVGRNTRRMGNELFHRVPSSCYKAGDGRYLQLVASTQRLWEMLTQLLGIPEAASDPDMNSQPARLKNREKVNALVTERLKVKSAAEWVEYLSEGGIPCGLVQTLDEVVADPQVIHREMVTTLDHPVSGKIRQFGIAPKLSKTPGQIRMSPPLLGQHTAEVLSELLGYDGDRIAAMERDDAIRCNPRVSAV